MISFHVAIHCLDWKPEMTAFPNLLGVGGQTVSSPAYRWRGATWRDSPHILFQLTLEGCGIFMQGRRRYDVRPGFGFLCQSHNPGISYHYGLREEGMRNGKRREKGGKGQQTQDGTGTEGRQRKLRKTSA